MFSSNGSSCWDLWERAEEVLCHNTMNNNSQHDIVYDISCVRRAPLRGSADRTPARVRPSHTSGLRECVSVHALQRERAGSSLSSNAATHESRGHVDYTSTLTTKRRTT